MLALIGAGFSISSSLRPRAEEGDGHAEVLLATALPRWRWALSHLAVTVGGTVAVVVAAGLGLGLGYSLVTGDGSAAVRLFLATVPYVAPVLVLVSVTWLGYGLVRRWAVVGWAGLGFCVVVMLFGQTLRLPAWVSDISPFSHLALAPAQPFDWTPFVVLLTLALLVSTLGIVALRRRDLG
jgi:ABC-2 type transport system permease protein